MAWATLQPGQTLIFSGPPGIGKSTRFPLTLAQGGSSVLVVTPTEIGARTLREYVRPPSNLQYRSSQEVYQQVLRKKALPWDFLVLDDIQLAKLDQALLVLMAQHLQARLLLVGIAVPAPILSLLREEPLRLRYPGQAFPVSISYLPADPVDDEDLAQQIGQTLRELLPSVDGHVLIIARSSHFCDFLAPRLLGVELQRADQEPARAWAPGRQKVILATPVLEVTVTIPDLQLVIDTMQTELPRSRPNGRTRLLRSEISRLQAEQRAGRTGRTRVGVCARMCSEGTFLALPLEYPAEIEALDLTIIQAQLYVHGWPSELIPHHLGKLGLAELRALSLLQPNQLERCRRISQRPYTLLPNYILDLWLQAGQPAGVGEIFASLIEVAGPFLVRSYGPRDPRTEKWAGPSDFHAVLNLYMDPSKPAELLEPENWRELQALTKDLRPEGDPRKYLRTLQELLRRELPGLLWAYDDSLGKWVHPDGRQATGNNIYPILGQPRTAAVLATQESVITLLLGLDEL